MVKTQHRAPVRNEVRTTGRAEQWLCPSPVQAGVWMNPTSPADGICEIRCSGKWDQRQPQGELQRGSLLMLGLEQVSANRMRRRSSASFFLRTVKWEIALTLPGSL